MTMEEEVETSDLGLAWDMIEDKAKRKNMCVSCYISKKIRVGRSLLILF